MGYTILGLEDPLEGRFPEEYRNYKKRTGRWVPRIGKES